jgi:hypothetical protein
MRFFLVGNVADRVSAHAASAHVGNVADRVSAHAASAHAASAHDGVSRSRSRISGYELSQRNRVRRPTFSRTAACSTLPCVSRRALRTRRIAACGSTCQRAERDGFLGAGMILPRRLRRRLDHRRRQHRGRPLFRHEPQLVSQAATLDERLELGSRLVERRTHREQAVP